MPRTIEIKVILHTENGDVVTVYPINPNEPTYNHENAKMRHSAMELFRAYFEDGKQVTMSTVTY